MYATYELRLGAIFVLQILLSNQDRWCDDPFILDIIERFPKQPLTNGAITELYRAVLKSYYRNFLLVSARNIKNIQDAGFLSQLCRDIILTQVDKHDMCPLVGYNLHKCIYSDTFVRYMVQLHDSTSTEKYKPPYRRSKNPHIQIRYDVEMGRIKENHGSSLLPEREHNNNLDI